VAGVAGMDLTRRVIEMSTGIITPCKLYFLASVFCVFSQHRPDNTENLPAFFFSRAA